MSPAEIALAITRFERECERNQHTDTERAWELLNAARSELGGLRFRAPEMPPITATADRLVAAALDYLIIARELLKAARAPKAVERVRLAISSAKGAKRHADNMETREEWLRERTGEARQ